MKGIRIPEAALRRTALAVGASVVATTLTYVLPLTQPALEQAQNQSIHLQQPQAASLVNRDFLTLQQLKWAQFKSLLPDTTPADTQDATPPIFTYTVKQGDSLWGIAAQYGTSVASLAAANNMSINTVLQPGQKLTVLTRIGMIHEVAAGESLSSIAQRYDVAVGDVADANQIQENATLAVGTKLIIPIDPTRSAGAQADVHIASTASASVAIFQWPVQGPITAPFGYRVLFGRKEFHEGLDIAVPYGTPVHAAAGGTVILSGWYGAYGYAVEIRHPNGLVTLYGHNERLLVSQGQQVAAGQTISLSGSTGRSTGPHVHFGVYRDGNPINPWSLLPH